ncbi:pilus assembly protein TadG-related protein [Streptomyces sp. NPDC101115]|uniref:pilus assembly protein TadG-related protein n=1 Tax=Streptomyces sp. NPDC101115 TaxID=3366106 RepID=UPI003825A003
MSSLRAGDSGQAFPVYITVMAGLLFLAFVYFAVAQAAVTRSGGQTAADAAALAAAQDARDQLRDGWREVILDPEAWDDYLRGRLYVLGAACDRAAGFARDNGATLAEGDCTDQLSGGGVEFRVRVSTIGTVGSSLVPGTEDRHAEATATAILKPLCSFSVPEPTPEPTTPTPTGSATPDPTPTPSPEPEPITGLVCDGVTWTIDPEDPRLPDAADLFTVRLVD